MENEHKKNGFMARPSLASKMVSKKGEDQQKKPTQIQMTDGVLIPNKNDNHVFNSWRITFFLAIAMLLFLTIAVPDPYRSIFLVVIKGAPTTFQVTVLAIIGAIFIGLFAGLGAVSKSRVVNMISGVYVEFIRESRCSYN